MSWNYRVCKKTEEVVTCDLDTGGTLDHYTEDQFGICEVYYNDEGRITFTTENFQEPYGETLDELKWSFERMKEAFNLPVLDLDNLVYAEINE